MRGKSAAVAARFLGAVFPALALEHVSIVDLSKGEISKPRTVLIERGRIAAIGETVKIPRNAERVEARGLFLLPGLVDMHVHLFNNYSHRPPNEWSFPLFLANGVTGVREMRTKPDALPLAKSWIAPRVLAAGCALRAQSPAEARTQVREFKRAGADFVKIFSEVRAPVWRAAVDEARLQKIPICGHVPAEISALEAARAGQRSNEHLTQLFEACSSREAEFLKARQGLSDPELAKLREAQEREILQSYDQATCDRVAAELARIRQAQVPTLVLPKNDARRDRANFRDDPRWPLLRADERARWERILGAESNEEAELANLRWEVSQQIVRTLHAAGVPIFAGTDTPMPLVYPGFSLHDELELFVECGMTPVAALRAATSGPAEFLGLAKERGSIAVGKRADLILLEANPLEEISNARRVHAVLLDGRLYRRAELEGFLRPAVVSDNVELR